MTPPVTLKTQQLNQDEYKKPTKEKFNQVLQELANNVTKIETTIETVKNPKVELNKHDNSNYDPHFERVYKDREFKTIQPSENYATYVDSDSE